MYLKLKLFDVHDLILGILVEFWNRQTIRKQGLTLGLDLFGLGLDLTLTHAWFAYQIMSDLLACLQK